jgi:hypothetical protein
LYGREGRGGKMGGYFSSMGTTNAAVLPDPVRAIPTTSFPSRIAGIALRWIGVGRLYPFRLMPRRMAELSPNVSAKIITLNSCMICTTDPPHLHCWIAIAIL